MQHVLHMLSKCTAVQAQQPSYCFATLPNLQAESSTYELVEARVGGSLTRHDVGINQTGPETVTTMKHFLLAGAGQLQDLHSKLQLDHPRGQAEQLHKCIASAATGRGVFDGNVKVGHHAGASGSRRHCYVDKELQAIYWQPAALLHDGSCHAVVVAAVC